ncbi:MAG: hydantoinase/oxoprolinase family protein [Bradyrhizobiaceae bacterium]|nr:MAG: hydantoinase/oxoprolinase family protein [Bradyrhizobiaceae bacterium]
MYSIDIDIGGTFTDGFFTDGSETRTAKVLTTPHDVTEGFMECIRFGCQQFDLELDEFLRRTSVARLSTTIGTNLLVQRKGARIGLLVSAGQEGKLYGSELSEAVASIVKPDMIVGISEKVDDQGVVTAPPAAADVLIAVRDLIHNGAQIIVVSFANAWLNNANERAVRDIIRERYPIHYLRSVVVQLSSEIVNDRNDHARTNSAILNAYIHADMARALFRAEDKLRSAGYDKPLLIVHASGGNARIAKTVALNTLHSGPAVAVKGAAILSDSLELNHVISADMGGTSFDIGLVVDRKADLDPTPRIEEILIATPTIRVDSFAIGGGSIAWLDETNTLRVGPMSASSAPGPAAYGKGGSEPTVTDANVVLGFIDPDYFLGGRMKLDVAAARRAIERRIARKLSISVEQAAFDIRQLADQMMGTELAKRVKEAGLKSEAVKLFSVGGAGPLHACQIADAAKLGGALAFPFGSVFSAFGGSNTDVQHRYRKTFVGSSQASALEAAIDSLSLQARRDMKGEGFSDGVRVRVEVELANRTLAVDGSIDDVGAMTKQLLALIKNEPVLAVEMISERQVPHWRLKTGPKRPAKLSPKSMRPIFWARDTSINTPVFDRAQLTPGALIEGPAMVEGNDTTYGVMPGWSLEVDGSGCFVFAAGRSAVLAA